MNVSMVSFFLAKDTIQNIPTFWIQGQRLDTLDPGHSQPFITSNQPKLGIYFGVELLILATFDPSSNILRVGIHDRPP